MRDRKKLLYDLVGIAIRDDNLGAVIFFVNTGFDVNYIAPDNGIRTDMLNVDNNTPDTALNLARFWERKDIVDYLEYLGAAE